ncbi:hypothetical protein LguiB_033207 [Lonicera macranthoides]
MNKGLFGAVVVFLVALVAMAVGQVAVMEEAVTCNINQLAPCVPAMTSPALPTADCCTRLKQQVPCLCGYLNDPAFGKYAKSTETNKVVKTCKVNPPKCK